MTADTLNLIWGVSMLGAGLSGGFLIGHWLAERTFRKSRQSWIDLCRAAGEGTRYSRPPGDLFEFVQVPHVTTIPQSTHPENGNI
jgi:hypothetical protein